MGASNSSEDPSVDQKEDDVGSVQPPDDPSDTESRASSAAMGGSNSSEDPSVDQKEDDVGSVQPPDPPSENLSMRREKCDVDWVRPTVIRMEDCLESSQLAEHRLDCDSYSMAMQLKKTAEAVTVYDDGVGSLARPESFERMPHHDSKENIVNFKESMKETK